MSGEVPFNGDNETPADPRPVVDPDMKKGGSTGSGASVHS